MADSVSPPGWKGNLRAQLQTDDPSSPANAMETLAKAWAEWRLGQLKNMGEDPTEMPFSPGGMAGKVTPYQVVRELIARAKARGVKPVAGPDVADIFKDRRWLKDQWKDVGGPGPTDVKFLGQGVESIAMEAVPKNPGSPNEVLKLMPEAKQGSSISRSPVMDPELWKQPFMAPTRGGVFPSSDTGYFVQPKLNMLPSAAYAHGQDMTGLSQEEKIAALVKLMLQFRQTPYRFADPHAGNVGFLGNEAKVLDLGAVSQRRPTAPPTQTPIDPRDVFWNFGVGARGSVPSSSGPPPVTAVFRTLPPVEP